MPEPSRTRKALKQLFHRKTRGRHVSSGTAGSGRVTDEKSGTPASLQTLESSSRSDVHLASPDKTGAVASIATSDPPVADRWEVAYLRFKARNAELANSFEFEWIRSDSSNSDDSRALSFQPNNFGAMIQAKLATRDANQLVIWCGSKPIKVREQSEKVIKFILASKDYVSLALTAQPYASLAWSGVCLVLPLVLNSSQQNIAMVGAIAEITDLLQLYHLREELYLDSTGINTTHGPHVAEFEQCVIDMYSQVIEFQAQIIHHLSQGSLRRAARGTMATCPWESWLAAIKVKDDHCQSFSSLIDRKKEDEYRETLRARDEIFQRTLVDAFLSFTRDTQSTRRDDDDEKLLEKLSSDYRAGKDINRHRINNTCSWLFDKSEELRSFRDRDDSALFWLSAGPGCGKSVVSRSIIDENILYSEGSATTSRICYFFFKDGQAGRTKATDALRAILHQILLGNASPELFEIVRSETRGFKKGDVTFPDLWRALMRVSAHPEAGRLVCVLDALDECDVQQTQVLLDSLLDFFDNDHAPDDLKRSLKFFVTSRPYDRIKHEFGRLESKHTLISMDGNDHSPAIAEDINKVIDYEVDTEFRWLHISDRDQIRECLKSKDNRTYLWLKLTMEIIRGSRAKYSSLKSVERLLNDVPTEYYDAYSTLLARSTYPELATMALQLVVAAFEPISLEEMNIALTMLRRHWKDIVEDRPKTEWPAAEFKSILENACGMLVQVFQDEVHLIHQTVREFLTGNSIESSQSTASPRIDLSKAHRVTCRLFVDYLLWDPTGKALPYESDAESEHGLTSEDTTISVTRRVGDNYDTQLSGRLGNNSTVYLLSGRFAHRCEYYWQEHYREMINLQNDPETIRSAQRICFDSAVLKNSSYKGHIHMIKQTGAIDLATACLIASRYGPIEVLDAFICQLQNVPNFDRLLGLALCIAARQQNTKTLLHLLKNGADPNSMLDNFSALALAYRWRKGDDMSLVQSLVDAGADPKGLGVPNEMTPLIAALLSKPDIGIVQYLLSKGALLDKFCWAGGALHITTESDEWLPITKLLIASGADVNLDDQTGFTPLMVACRNGALDTVKYLCEQGANIDTPDLLSEASASGEVDVAKYLIEEQALAITPAALDRAAKLDRLEMVKYLEKCGADVRAPDVLLAAVKAHSIDVIKHLVDHGADVHATDLLEEAVGAGHLDIVEFLVDCGANVDAIDLLYQAALYDYRDIVEYLVKKGANINASGALFAAARRGSPALVKVLLHQKADPNAIDRKGYSALAAVVEAPSDINARTRRWLERGRIWYHPETRRQIQNLLEENGAIAVYPEDPPDTDSRCSSLVSLTSQSLTHIDDQVTCDGSDFSVQPGDSPSAEHPEAGFERGASAQSSDNSNSAQSPISAPCDLNYAQWTGWL